MAVHSRMENSMDRGAWWATVHGVTKSWIKLSKPVCIYYSMNNLIPGNHGLVLQYLKSTIFPLKNSKKCHLKCLSL